MCGRYALTSPRKKLYKQFTIREFMEDEAGPAPAPRYNIAPAQPVPIVRQKKDHRELALVRWGLVPGWVKDLKQARQPINARCETAATSGMFRAAMKYRRCLVPTDGFYEWKTLGESAPGPRGGKGKPIKQPYYIRMADDELFAFAGLWEHWQDAHGNELETCTILTTTPNELMTTIHDRMPVILDPADYDRWLDPTHETADAVTDLLKPLPAEQMYAVPVSKFVNNPKHDGPACVEAIV